jgi:hypothetical protein
MDFPHPVPSIATQYIRNRKQHDATARQWTENYARPKSSPLPPVAVEALPSPKFTKGKGKKFADSGPSNTAGRSSSTTRPTRSAVVASSSAAAASVSAQSDVIFLDRMRRWQDLRMEKARKGREVKRIQRPPRSATPMRWPICWIRWKRERMPRQRRNETVIRRAEQAVNLLPAVADGRCSNLAMSSTLGTKT